jgi:hypothetical protein
LASKYEEHSHDFFFKFEKDFLENNISDSFIFMVKRGQTHCCGENVDIGGPWENLIWYVTYVFM